MNVFEWVSVKGWFMATASHIHIHLSLKRSEFPFLTTKATNSCRKAEGTHTER